LKKIGNGAFESATSLSSITIPASVQSIGQFAFYYAQSLETVSISQGSQLTSIGASAFSRVPALTSITIPASVTTIGISAFAVSAALMEVNFLGNTPTVGSNAFSRVASGAKAKIGYSATGFGDTGDLWNGLLVEANLVFDGDYVCTTGELRSQNDTSAAYTVINYVVTDGWDCGGAVVITEGVTSIGSSAFDKYYDAQTITSITIPATVTSLQETAFWGQELLSEVNFVGNAPSSVGIEVFQNVAAGAKAYITASATGFGTGTTWNGLVIDRAASVSAPVTNSPTTSSPVTNSPTTNTPVANTPTTSTPDTTTPVTTVPTTFAVTSYEVRFAAGSSVITQAHNNLIKKIVSKSGKSATFTVTGVAAKVVGVADSLAKVMAKARAEKIKTYLMKLGVRKSNILTKIKIVNSGVTPKTSILAKRAKP
jgi:outer membrane protein OmpA-like peptidoglycan-associated protein